MGQKTTIPLTIAWISSFPIEWLSDVPESVQRLPREHPLSWQRVLLKELENAPELRLHILILRKQFERDFTFKRNGVTFHLIKTPGGFRAPSLFWVDTVLIQRKLAEIKPDLVHAWGTERGAALVATRLPFPRIITIQGLMTWYGKVLRISWHDRLAAVLERYSLKRSPLITTESNFSVEWLRRHFPKARVEQIEHASDSVFHRVLRQPQTEPIRFLFVGTMDQRKGGDLLVRALDLLKNELGFELIVAGQVNAEMRESLRRQVSTDLWQRIVFKGSLAPPQIAQELSLATMMIFPTLADVSPNAVKEAVVASVPVIGSAIGGIPDYVIPDKNGTLFKSGNLTELIAAIRAACSHPLFSRGTVESNTLAKMREYLSPGVMGKRFLNIYRIAYEQQTNRDHNRNANT
jgi:glycosyltransferase involved in cell wall biosynthesis